jgi:hypothetical protein
MKKIFLAFTILSLLFFTQGCDKDLPYPIDEVTRGVVIDIVRIAGTDGLLSEGMTSGNYKVKLTIPEQQGDYSFMSHAQLLAILEASDGTYTAKVAVDNINEFPKEISIDMADVYSKLGKTVPALGQTLYFTVNVVLKNGSVIPGWTKEIGFNNKAFAGWMIDGRAYSYNVRYAVACPLDEDPTSGTFIGTFTCDETTPYGNDSYSVTLSHNPNLPAAADIPGGVTAANLYGVKISPISPNIWVPAIDEITVWINTEDLSLVIPNQDTGDKYSTGDAILWYNFRNASVSTCNSTIQFTTNPYIPGVGGWGAFTFSIHP